MSHEYSKPPVKPPTILHEEDEISSRAVDEVLATLNLDEIEDVLGAPPKSAETAIPTSKKSSAERVRASRKHTKHLIGATPRIVPDWRDEFAQRIRTLIDWLKSPKPSARKLRQHGRQIAEDWRTYQLFAAELRRIPTATEFGEKLRLDRHRGRDRMRRLTAMETSGGPWV
ncbi:MAG: hypothetical protein U1E81_12430 [Xanthobacteraceae bacterium]